MVCRPRSQEGNREDMCTPELKTPVYTRQVRPGYSVLARMNEGAETVLFGDKFSDWKGALGIIKVAEPSKKLIVGFLTNFNFWYFYTSCCRHLTCS